MKKKDEIKVCLVGSSGGHLTHLYMLKPFWKDKNRFWVTFDKEDARSLLEGEKVYPCYFPTNRSIKALIKNTKIAWDVDNNTVHETVKVLLYGRVVPGKGQLFYVQAAENILRNTSKPCTFYFAGKVEDEEYFNSCMQSIRQSGQENSIKYLGQISDIQNLLRDTDIVCVCSTKEEAYGWYRNVFLENYSELKIEIAELDALIEDLSTYMQSTGKKYADHAATLRSWSARKRKQQKPGTGIPDYTYNEEESL